MEILDQYVNLRRIKLIGTSKAETDRVNSEKLSGQGFNLIWVGLMVYYEVCVLEMRTLVEIIDRVRKLKRVNLLAKIELLVNEQVWMRDWID